MIQCLKSKLIFESEIYDAYSFLLDMLEDEELDSLIYYINRRVV